MTVTVSLSDSTYEKLIAFRGSSDMTDDRVIAELLEMACDIDDEPLSEETLQRIAEAREDFRAGRCRTLKEVMADLGDSFE
ncbi:hypothetical protein KSK55_13110 [Methanospirillum purgamenti]|uniref:Uncharacterized protein n=1 Tax=Methanospirillum hungatei TaxID=2203 RepID=A0A8F5VLC7_METHU|nr:hypothetical protein [Methanospirillum hungatei]QXO94256.1 hypothetical protein KSK55_13110 [Methanospirillum hungatei]